MFYLIKKLFLSFTLFSNLISQIIYCVIHRCLYSLFIYTFFVLLYQFWRDCIFKVTWCNQFKFSVFGNIKRVFRWFAFIQANIFLKLKRILTEINISWVKSWRARPTPSCVNLTQIVGRFDMWVTPKTNTPSFCLILKLSNAPDGLCSVYII